jgi:ribonucleoside-triphosphate reductase
MVINQSFDKEFSALMAALQKKYPAELFNLEGIGRQLDICEFSKDFFAAKTTADASVDANANVTDTSNITYHVELPKPFFKLNSYFMLWKHARKLYGTEVANEIVEEQLTGGIYINDFHGIAAGSPYCFNYSTYDIMLGGLTMIDKIKSVPPKYLYSFKSQLEQFVVIASNATLGAAGLADMLLVMSLYVRRILRTQSDAGFRFADEESCWKYVKENLVSLIYTLNQPLRGNQSPFTNVSVYDDAFLDQMLPGYIDPETGEAADRDLVKALQCLYLDTMNEEMRRTPVTFPVTTGCFAVDDQRNLIDEAFALTIAEKNIEFGFINIYCGKSSTLSSCCRLRSETDNEYFNSFGAGSTKIGSLGVCTINLPRAAFKSVKGGEAAFLAEVKALVGMAQRVNNTKRHIVRRRIENGNLPLYTLGFMDLAKQYSTVGVTGLNEACEILGFDILTKEGQDFVIRVLDTINHENDRYQKQYKAPQNCEQIPGENVSIKLADKDRLLKYNDRYRLYSNQFIPLVTEADMLDRIHLQGLFDAHFSGGAICHVNVEQKIDDPQRVVDLIKYCAAQGVVYWAINYNIQRCADGHMSVGKGAACGMCGGPITDNFTRVVGFLTAVKNWAKTRREVDYPERQFYGTV